MTDQLTPLPFNVIDSKCPTCEGVGLIQLDSFYMVGPSAREALCPDCLGNGYRTHVADVRKVDYQQRFYAACACGWRQNRYCSLDGATKMARRHERTGE